MAARRTAGRDLWIWARNLVVVLVTVSAALTAIFAGASPRIIAGTTVIGFGVGLLLAAGALPSRPAPASENRFEWDE